MSLGDITEPMFGDGDQSTLIRGSQPPAHPSALYRLTVNLCPEQARIGARLPLPEAGRLLALGRDVHDGVVISDPHVSRLHVRIVRDPVTDGFRLGDAGSANGTFVNGQRVSTHLLAPGDVVRIGDTILVFDDATAERQRSDLVARFGRSDLPVLILGETGTGKEVTARALHGASGLTGSFVAVNCAAFTRDLLGSELFGHLRGSFSGATRDRKGLFLAAAGGTLFLDEVGDLPLELQPALLRVLEDKRVRPLGSDRDQQVDVRIVAATNVDLDDPTSSPLRRDLFARLAQLVIRLPRLAERRGEILPLARLFAREQGIELELDADAAEALLLWSYPENVRELQSIVRTFTVAADGGRFDIAFLTRYWPRMALATADEPVVAAESGPGDHRRELQRLLEECGGNVSAVAERIGKPRAQIYRWMKVYSLSADNYRE